MVSPPPEHVTWCSLLPRGPPRAVVAQHGLEQNLLQQFLVLGQSRKGQPPLLVVGNGITSSRSCHSEPQQVAQARMGAWAEKLCPGIEPAGEKGHEGSPFWELLVARELT